MARIVVDSACQGNKMRVAILTSSSLSTASACLPQLATVEGVELAAIIYSEGTPPRRQNWWRGKLRKVRKIGVLGALNGIRMRRWFSAAVAEELHLEDLHVLAARHGIPLFTTPAMNSQRTIGLLHEAKVDLALSLGNSYITRDVFAAPRFGTINVHGEILPEFRGAQSVIWQIHEGSGVTGFTIHQMDDRIDAGVILYQEVLPISVRPSLAETVTHNCARITRAAAAGLVHVITNYEKLAATAKCQEGGRSFTTPTFRQYLRMVANHRRLLEKSRASGSATDS